MAEHEEGDAAESETCGRRERVDYAPLWARHSWICGVLCGYVAECGHTDYDYDLRFWFLVIV